MPLYLGWIQAENKKSGAEFGVEGLHCIVQVKWWRRWWRGRGWRMRMIERADLVVHAFGLMAPTLLSLLILLLAHLYLIIRFVPMGIDSSRASPEMIRAMQLMTTLLRS